MVGRHLAAARENGPESTLNVIALCGSLRAASINAALLRAAARLSPPEMQVRPLSEIGELPLFNCIDRLNLQPEAVVVNDGSRPEAAVAVFKERTSNE